MSPRSFAPFGVAVFALAMLLNGAGCSRERGLKEISDPPDFVQRGRKDPRWHAYELRAFQVNHVWAGGGYAPDGADYRLKVTVWSDDRAKNTPVAEFYFHEPNHLEAHHNPDPNKAPGQPWQVHFPMSASSPVMQTLRNANDRVFLYYEGDQWAVGVLGAEPVGID